MPGMRFRGIVYLYFVPPRDIFWVMFFGLDNIWSSCYGSLATVFRGAGCSHIAVLCELVIGDTSGWDQGTGVDPTQPLILTLTPKQTPKGPETSEKRGCAAFASANGEKIAGLITGHDPARGSSQDLYFCFHGSGIESSRVESGRVGSGRQVQTLTDRVTRTRRNPT